MHVLVTGVAGFLGYHVSKALLDDAVDVTGIDNLTPYYDVSLKEARLDILHAKTGFSFIQGDITDADLFSQIATHYPHITHIIHLAAQAGVRQSVYNPQVYLHSNVNGQLQVLEFAKTLSHLEHMIYASSSSVYGDSCPIPFAESTGCESPMSFYGVTKRAGEVMAQHYHQLHGLPITGLRLFTCYGPYGRPDMAYYSFTKALYAGEPITLFHQGQMQRDFTYVSDTVDGILAVLRHVPQKHQLINIGNNSPHSVTELLESLERATGKKAVIHNAERQQSEPLRTCADISLATELLNYSPKTQLNDGITRFVAWFCDYHGLS